MTSPSPRPILMPLIRLALLFGLILLSWWLVRPNIGLPRELETAQTALQAGNVVQAQAQFEKALAAHPDDLRTYEQIIDLCEINKQWRLMITYTQSALCVFKDESNTNRAKLNILLSTAYQEAEPQRPQTNALYAAESAWQLDPYDADVQNAYGYILVDNGQKLEDASKLIQQALKTTRTSLDPDMKNLFPAVEDSYGWVLYKQERFKEAADTLLKALYDYPEGTSGEALKVSYYHLGATYRQLQEFEEARQALRSALFYDADYADAKAEMAQLPPSTSPAPAAATPAAAASITAPTAPSVPTPSTVQKK
ncbi:MAG TPA: tetratricopeptide repeat protein [Chthonomonadaceae bacterium]|nr:tetratricopeptide repeat protein [Chthonomonadaceae bacterium]